MWPSQSAIKWRFSTNAGSIKSGDTLPPFTRYDSTVEFEVLNIDYEIGLRAEVPRLRLRLPYSQESGEWSNKSLTVWLDDLKEAVYPTLECNFGLLRENVIVALVGKHSASKFEANPRTCETLFLARYIEKYGTGTLMMIRESLSHDLPEPDFVMRGGEFTTTVWRDWVTAEVLAGYNLSERQIKAAIYLKINERITNSQYQEEFSVAKRTASLDLAELVAVGLIEKVGSTGKGVYYQLAKGASKGQKGYFGDTIGGRVYILHKIRWNPLNI